MLFEFQNTDYIEGSITTVNQPTIFQQFIHLVLTSSQITVECDT